MIKPYIQLVNLIKWESIDDHAGLREVIIEAYQLTDFSDDHFFALVTLEVKNRELIKLETEILKECLVRNQIINYNTLEVILTDLCHKGYFPAGSYIVDFE